MKLKDKNRGIFVSVEELDNYISERKGFLSNVEFDFVAKQDIIVGYEYKSLEGLFGTHYIWTKDGKTWGVSVYQENSEEIRKPFVKNNK